MKRTTLPMMICSLAIGWTSSVRAEPKPDAGSRESLLMSRRLAPLSIGADYENFTREVLWVGGGAATLEGKGASAYIGFDPIPWLTIFGTAGQISADMGGPGEAGDDTLWSVGASINFWHIDLTHPEFISGRLSIRGGAEGRFADFEDPTLGAGKWVEQNFSVTANYEIYVQDRAAVKRVPYSLMLNVGWLVSKIEGEVGVGAARRDFEEDRATAVTAGVELFVSSNLSLGVHLQSFESSNWRASLRYRF
ncbi:MAG: hypothetical protein U1E27_04930 [Kiritimatiellia bacterium]|nr:hypothetical protein [Kiritimatiellia bacterium]